jgi:hypothetical protein
MTEAPDTALSLALSTMSSASNEAAVSPLVAPIRPVSMTLFSDSTPAVKTQLAPDLDTQTFGALGGSRHIELQAKPCLFSSDSSAVFFDEVHDSIVTVQPSIGRKPGLPFELWGVLILCCLLPRRQCHIRQVYFQP